jgi:hypothetical protein
MATNKTAQTEISVTDFLDSVQPEQRQKDGKVLLDLYKEVTGLPPKMWGPTMIGFGSYHYKYDSGHEGDSFRAGFSPRKTSLAIYLVGLGTENVEELKNLGKHKTSGGSCLYINKLSDVDMNVLKDILVKGFKNMNEKYG